MRVRRLIAVLAALELFAACGIKAPPQPPTPSIPDAGAVAP